MTRMIKVEICDECPNFRVWKGTGIVAVCMHPQILEIHNGGSVIKGKIPNWCPLDKYEDQQKLREIHRQSDSNAEVAAQVRMMVTDWANCPKMGDPE